MAESSGDLIKPQDINPREELKVEWNPHQAEISTSLGKAQLIASGVQHKKDVYEFVDGRYNDYALKISESDNVVAEAKAMLALQSTGSVPNVYIVSKLPDSKGCFSVVQFGKPLVLPRQMEGLGVWDRFKKFDEYATDHPKLLIALKKIEGQGGVHDGELKLLENWGETKDHRYIFLDVNPEPDFQFDHDNLDEEIDFINRQCGGNRARKK